MPDLKVKLNFMQEIGFYIGFRNVLLI